MIFKIIASTWRTPGKTEEYIGIVARDISFNEEKIWCAYIGICNLRDEEMDEIEVAQWGAKLTAQEAHAFFPHLDIKEYKK